VSSTLNIKDLKIFAVKSVKGVVKNQSSTTNPGLVDHQRNMSSSHVMEVSEISIYLKKNPIKITEEG